MLVVECFSQDSPLIRGLAQTMYSFIAMYFNTSRVDISDPRSIDINQIRLLKITTPLGIEPRISGSVDQRLIHWAMESIHARNTQTIIIYVGFHHCCMNEQGRGNSTLKEAVVDERKIVSELEEASSLLCGGYIHSFRRFCFFIKPRPNTCTSTKSDFRHHSKQMAGRVQIPTNNSALIAMIADEDTVVGFLLAGVGNVDLRKKTNYLIVDSKTTVKQIEDAFKEFTTREDVAIVLISQYLANMIRFLVDSYNKPVPAILEIPSKDHPYDPSHDSVLSRVKYLFSAESVASDRR
ncbi:hypothetical protein RIF29_40260 [Crotalaria pallida]|uniref:V-type proton ATPase subunit F n=1 Tax=Crotalaria pallida TaxID=3830 RepID=A0AAN9HNB2_CROPI